MNYTKDNPLRASQPTGVAVLILMPYGRTAQRWHYQDQRHGSHYSEAFKDTTAAIRAALDRGFAAVMLDGKVVARRSS